MAAAYDTHLDDPQRTLVQDGLVTALGALLTSADPPGFLRAVIPYPTVVQGSEREIALLLEELRGRDPAIAVVVGKGKYSPLSSTQRRDQYEKRTAVHVYYLTRNLKGMLARSRGDARSLADGTKDPGLNRMMELGEQILIGWKANDTGRGTIYQLEPDEEDEVETDLDYSLWRQLFYIRLDRRIDRRRDITQALTLLHTRTLEAGVAAGLAAELVIGAGADLVFSLDGGAEEITVSIPADTYAPDDLVAAINLQLAGFVGGDLEASILETGRISFELAGGGTMTCSTEADADSVAFAAQLGWPGVAEGDDLFDGAGPVFTAREVTGILIHETANP